MMKISQSQILIILFTSLCIFLSACVTVVETPANEWIASETPELTATATTVWFPATATPTIPPADTPTPNPAARPIYGSLMFSDSFTGDSPWKSEQNASGYVIVKEGVLTLAVKSTRGSLYSFRESTNLINYYLETTANVGLCKGNDQIGVLFRVNGSQSYYRLLINCQGQVSLQQVAGGTPVVLLDWSLSSVPAGLFKPIKIGIWQSGSKIRIYLNEELQFEATSDYFKNGGIGFYAHADGESPLTVNFTSLNVFEVPKITVTTSTP